MKVHGIPYGTFILWQFPHGVCVQNENQQWAALRANQTGKAARMGFPSHAEARTWIDNGCKAEGLNFEWATFEDGAKH